MDELHHLSLCTGIAGIDLGLKRVLPNLRTVAYVEREAFACANLVSKIEAGSLDEAPVYTDLRSFPYAKYRGCVDILSSGFPCQPFAVCGKRRGVEDDRHLWPFIAEGIQELQPGACFFENVEGIISTPSLGYHAVLHHVLADLEQLGFRAAAGCFTSAEVGAPHQRRRWFILAVADSNFERLEGWERPVLERTYEWPAGPGCAQRSNEPPRTTQCGLGGKTDGFPRHRVDRLRSLGNACVPDQVSNAYAELWSVLNDER